MHKVKKSNRGERARLLPIESQYPFGIVSVNLLKLDKPKEAYEYVLVVTDNFTRYIQAYGKKYKSEKSTVDKLSNNCILTYGFPQQILHD